MRSPRRYLYVLVFLLIANTACTPTPAAPTAAASPPPTRTPLQPTATPAPTFADLETFFYTRQTDAGLAAAEHLLAQDPDDASVLALRAALRARGDDLAGAEADTEQALELDPDNAYAHAVHSMLLYLDDELPAALAEVDRALELNPDLPIAYSIRANILNQQGDTTAALEAADRAIELRPDYATAIRNRGSIYLMLGALDTALDEFNRALNYGPDAGALDGRAGVYQQQGNYEAALINHNRAIELAPDESYYYYNRAQTYTIMGDNQAAIADLGRAIELDEDPVYYEEHMWLLLEEGDIEAAADDARRLAELNPDDPITSNSAAYFLALADRDLDQAQAFIEVALNADPEDMNYLETQGYIYYRQGNIEAAREIYTRLVEAGFLYAHYGMGLVQQTDGDNAEAAYSFQMFLNQYPDEFVSDDARERLEALED